MQEHINEEQNKFEIQQSTVGYAEKANDPTTHSPPTT
jgi:hypothetical protein